MKHNINPSLDNFLLTTRLKDLLAWSRKNSLWPYIFGTACCGIEYMAVLGPKYDISRFGAEVVRFSPRQADVLIVAGTITDKMAPVIKKVYEQMSEPKWVVAMGACAASGGFYRAYHVLQGVDEIIPVDVYIPGCPPTPEACIAALLKLQDQISKKAKEKEALLTLIQGNEFVLWYSAFLHVLFGSVLGLMSGFILHDKYRNVPRIRSFW